MCDNPKTHQAIKQISKRKGESSPDFVEASDYQHVGQSSILQITTRPLTGLALNLSCGKLGIMFTYLPSLNRIRSANHVTSNLK
jgi:hypothetical protein